VATTAVGLFEAQAVHRDALAALVMLRSAVLAEAVTSETLRRVADYLEELRRNPTAHLEQPS